MPLHPVLTSVYFFGEWEPGGLECLFLQPLLVEEENSIRVPRASFSRIDAM